MSTPDNEPPWERQLLEKVAFAALHEQRAKRRWGIFFKLAGLTYLVAVLVLVAGGVVFLGFYDVPPPTAKMEVQIPNDRLSLQ